MAPLLVALWARYVFHERVRRRIWVALALGFWLHARSAARGQLIQTIDGIPFYYRQFGYEYALESFGGRRVYWSAVDADKDIALDRSMIPLGSCTMKLNATAEMEAISWPEFASIHPFAPDSQTVGWRELIGDLEALIIEGERGWRELYAELGVIPYEVVYEDLVSEEGFEQTVRGVLGRPVRQAVLGVQHELDGAVARPCELVGAGSLSLESIPLERVESDPPVVQATVVGGIETCRQAVT